MKVIRPITIDTPKVVSSSATEEYEVWVSGKTFAKGGRVVFSEIVYESLLDGNLGKQPDTHPNDWLAAGASNKMSMFDLQVNTQTKAQETLTVKFAPGKPFDAVAFLNLVGKHANLTVRDGVGGQVVYTADTDLDNNSLKVINWYTYFFEDFDFRSEVIFQNIPPYSTGVVEITLSSGTGEPVAIGSTSVGTITDLGSTQYGLSFGIRDFSVKEFNSDFGTVKFVERAFSKRMNANLLIANERLNYITNVLQSLRAVPTLYIGTDCDPKYTVTAVFGFVKDWNVEIPYYNHSLISVEINGLI